MPIRFPTEAANDPGMRPAAPDAPAQEVDAGSTPRGVADATQPANDPRREPRSGDSRERDPEPDR